MKANKFKNYIWRSKQGIVPTDSLIQSWLLSLHLSDSHNAFPHLIYLLLMLVIFMKLNSYVVESVYVVWLTFSTPETKEKKPLKSVTQIIQTIEDWRLPMTAFLKSWHNFVLSWFYTGVPNIWDLMPDDLRWSWHNNNGTKVHNKCNLFELS